MQNKERYEAILASDKLMQHLKQVWGNKCDSLYLTGGAVVDILEGRAPKDYDFHYTSSFDIPLFLDRGREMGFDFDYSSATAISFVWEGLKVQILRKPLQEFPFTIECSRYSVKTGKLQYFCDTSFEKKVLIPQDSAYNAKTVNKDNFKLRLRKWESKGYRIHRITRSSYLRQCTGYTFWQRVENFFSSSKSGKES